MVFEDLVMRPINSIEKIGEEALIFHMRDGKAYKMHHHQGGGESVYIEDICGDLDDFKDTLIVRAEEVSESDTPPINSDYEDSHTWTFYKLDSPKGDLVIRWYGTSNGYYSESVCFEEI